MRLDINGILCAETLLDGRDNFEDRSQDLSRSTGNLVTTEMTIRSCCHVRAS